MERQPVNSSALKSIGYDQQNEILELEFRDNGGIWQYLAFAPSAYKKFLNANSLGGHFVRKIKGKYKELKVSG